jgi:HSP20 family protein
MLNLRGYCTPSIWDEMNRFNREMNQSLAQRSARTGTTSSGNFPRLEVRDEGTSFVISAEVPGFSPEEIELEVKDNSLTIKGGHTVPVDQDEKSEKKPGKTSEFSRSVEFYEAIDSDKIEATYRYGVLEISVPRAEQAKAHKIKIKAA